jgi:hypothetical protein
MELSSLEKLLLKNFPTLYGEAKVHYRPPLVLILDHTDPVHTTPFPFSKIHFNIILAVFSVI